MNEMINEGNLWDALKEREGEVFKTLKGLEFTYEIRGREMFIDRKEKSITESTVLMSYRKAMETDGIVSGPKKLGTFGASYIYPLFLALEIIEKG